MNITAIYDKYDLWGKVRVSARNSIFLCHISVPGYSATRTGNTVYDALRNAIKAFIDCEYCEGMGVVPAEPYTASGGIPDCDVVRCEKCEGTGDRI